MKTARRSGKGQGVGRERVRPLFRSSGSYLEIWSLVMTWPITARCFDWYQMVFVPLTSYFIRKADCAAKLNFNPAILVCVMSGSSLNHELRESESEASLIWVADHLLQAFVYLIMPCVQLSLDSVFMSFKNIHSLPCNIILPE